MAHWLDDSRVGQTKPITYTKGADKYHAQTVTPATYAPISEQQGKDRNTAAALNPKSKPGDYKGYAGDLYTALSAYLSGPVLQMAIVQLYMESGGFSNGPAVKDNNPGNIIWYKGSKRGVYMPGNKTYAAHFDTLQQFAAVYVSLLEKEPGRPIDAKDLPDFAHRLKLNGYFGKESEASYLAKLQGTASRLKNLDTFYKAADKKMSKAAHQDSWFKRHPLATGLLLALGGIAVIKAVK